MKLQQLEEQGIILQTLHSQKYSIVKYHCFEDKMIYLIKIVQLKLETIKATFFQTLIKMKIDYLNRRIQKKLQFMFPKSILFYSIRNDEDSVIFSIGKKYQERFLSLHHLFNHHSHLLTQFKKTESLQATTINLLDLFLRGGSPQNFFFSLKNVSFDISSSLWTINLISFVGIQLLLDENMLNTDFDEVYHCLDSDFFNRKPNDRMNQLISIRSLLYILLCIIINHQVKLNGNTEKQMILSFKDIKQKVANSPRVFQRLLSFNSIKKPLKQAEAQTKINYGELFYKIFVEERKITWMQLKRILVNKISIEDSHKIIFHKPQTSICLLELYNSAWHHETEEEKQFYIRRHLVDEANQDYEIYMLVKFNICFRFQLRNQFFIDCFGTQSNYCQDSVKMMKKLTQLFNLEIQLRKQVEKRDWQKSQKRPIKSIKKNILDLPKISTFRKNRIDQNEKQPTFKTSIEQLCETYQLISRRLLNNFSAKNFVQLQKDHKYQALQKYQNLGIF